MVAGPGSEAAVVSASKLIVCPGSNLEILCTIVGEVSREPSEARKLVIDRELGTVKSISTNVNGWLVLLVTEN